MRIQVQARIQEVQVGAQSVPPQVLLEAPLPVSLHPEMSLLNMGTPEILLADKAPSRREDLKLLRHLCHPL